MKLKKYIPALAILIMLAVVLVLVITVLRQQPHNVANCQETDPVEADFITLEITDSGFEPTDATLRQCGNLFVVNSSSEDVSLAFGVHDDHYDYPGFAEHTVAPGDFSEVSLAQHGEFILHDHLREDNQLLLTVEKDNELIQFPASEVFKSDSSHRDNHGNDY